MDALKIKQANEKLGRSINAPKAASTARPKATAKRSYDPSNIPPTQQARLLVRAFVKFHSAISSGQVPTTKTGGANKIKMRQFLKAQGFPSVVIDLLLKQKTLINLKGVKWSFKLGGDVINLSMEHFNDYRNFRESRHAAAAEESDKEKSRLLVVSGELIHVKKILRQFPDFSNYLFIDSLSPKEEENTRPVNTDIIYFVMKKLGWEEVRGFPGALSFIKSGRTIIWVVDTPVSEVKFIPSVLDMAKTAEKYLIQDTRGRHLDRPVKSIWAI
jgi:hypothetical protein